MKMVLRIPTHWFVCATATFLYSASLSRSNMQVEGFVSTQITHPFTESKKRIANLQTLYEYPSAVLLKLSKPNAENGNQTDISDDPSSFDPTVASPELIPMVMEGGPAQIFAMARKMLIWDESSIVNTDSNKESKNDPTPTTATTSTPTTTTTTTSDKSHTLPRWHPHAGISDYNPSFRSKAPAMNSMGYANAIRRNSRKRNKPAMWRYALRTYKRMSPKIQQRNIHHESALVACAKLGLWEEAFAIFQKVEKLQLTPMKEEPLTPENKSKSKERHWKPPSITDNMVHSLIKACVRASRHSNSKLTSDNQQRLPLDSLVKDVLAHLAKKYEIQICANHVNPIASAYQSLGLYDEASNLIHTYLTDRPNRGRSTSSFTSSMNVGKQEKKNRNKKSVTKKKDAEELENVPMQMEEDLIDDKDDYEEDPIERNRLNVMDIGAKDRGSYSLLVKGAATQGDWKQAVEALEDMTNAGIYPEMECLHTWTEAIEDKGGSPREERENSLEDALRDP